MILGLTEPTVGLVSACGFNSTTHSGSERRRLSHSHACAGFKEFMTAFENLVYTAELNGISRGEAKEKAVELLHRVGLGEELKKRTGQYSKGMRQRLGLADVMIKNPEVIILDEPTSGIDPAGVQDFIRLIQQLSDETGLTVLFSSHHLNQVQTVCDRAALFNQGRLLTVLDINDLKDTPGRLEEVYNDYLGGGDDEENEE